MSLPEFINQLGYAASPFYLAKGTKAFATAESIGHILRAAAKPGCSLQGVYTLRPQLEEASSTQTPIVYICKAKTEAEADTIHRLVWNQDATPFLIVYTPKGVKFYSGFEYTSSGEGRLTSLLAFNDASALAKQFHADEIDSGRFWKEWGKRVRPEQRVNWRLLHNLKTLDVHLQNNCGLSRRTSHALIGKYVYLHYLRDRGILSDRKLASWGVSESQLFGLDASITKLKHVVRKLDVWLNGRVFPISFSADDAPSPAHVQQVAGIFAGDEISAIGDRQLSLEFKAYDFSFIPIETLSVVYEQFLHAPGQDGKSKGRDEGAYYTPIPVVNLMLAEMEERLPLEDGVKVFDPACGSGAFLVQCYRRLIEKTYPQHVHKAVELIELRRLLVDNIFGLDRDKDACDVSELSLLLTLLDYVNPPDLEDDRRRKLPTLRDKNIFCEDFFELFPPALKKEKFGWIVGNPPWKKLNPRRLKQDDRHAWKWMQQNEKHKPVGGNQLARAFAWRIMDVAHADTEIGLFMPAMTLFDKQATSFRKRFFQKTRLRSVMNFSNMAEVIAAGRFRVPAASIYFSLRRDDESDTPEKDVRVFSPLVANQVATKPETSGERIESWCIVVNESEIRDLPYEQIANGDALPWKMATWGSHFDTRLLSRLEKKFPTIGQLQDKDLVTISEGPALRSTLIKRGENKTEKQNELVGKNELDTSALARLRYVFSVPETAVKPCDKHYLRVRAGRRTVTVCRGPHVIVSAARNFAIYTEDYLVVPSRQIGIISPTDDRDFLKALSLFLSSDYAYYHQFLSSSQFGVKRDVATLDALKAMPCPLTLLKREDLKKYVKLHGQLQNTQPRRVGALTAPSEELFPTNDALDELLAQLNQLVFESLGLTDREQALVTDLVNVRLKLNDGKVGQSAVEKPNVAAMKRYGLRLQRELDAFFARNSQNCHTVEIVYGRTSGMICVDFVTSNRKNAVSVAAADKPTAQALVAMRDKLRDEIGQWAYFDRNLRIYDGARTYLFKPMQMFHWTESQAMIDASEMIAETVSAQGDLD